MPRRNEKKEYLQTGVQWAGVDILRGHNVGVQETKAVVSWRILYLNVITFIVFGILFVSVVNLQVVHGRDSLQRSQRNRLEEHIVQPDRGLIYDRNGEKLAVNVPSFDVILDPRRVNEEDLGEKLELLEELIGLQQEDSESKYLEIIEAEPQARRVLLKQDISRDDVLKIRSHADELDCIWIDYSSKREYMGGDMFSHILGYTGEASQEFVEGTDGINIGDIVGRDGVESYYDNVIRGIKGVRVVEIDAAQNVVAEYINIGSEPVAGESLYLSIDADSQRKMSEILKEGMETYDASGAAAVLENIKTGEIISAVSIPGYDNNLFVGGISSKDYGNLINDKGLPLFNRVISAQEPPGSMFKTIVASAALEENAITRDTVFVSTGVIYLGDGTFPFQEYHMHAYGPLDLIGGIAKSSNIYFCKTMLELGIDKFVPYAEFFGIGDQTGVDLPGEMSGRLPSPENKIKLAETSPWLDPIWYMDGDSCNTAIGQGITTVTPIQVANWAATIANGGDVLQPRFSKKWVLGDVESNVETVVLRDGKVSDNNLTLVSEGMRNSVSGPLRVIVPLEYAKVPVAAKTGTAEFGVKDETGTYTKVHAWVMGFFPYENPEYSFVVFLEGGGQSNNSAELARQFIDWFAEEKM